MTCSSGCSFRPVAILLVFVVNFGLICNSEQNGTATTSSLRPEYIHPEGVEMLDPYLNDFQTKDQTDEEDNDDYIPLPDQHESIQGLPIFLMEPKSSYTLKNKPASLLCRAANALQVFFKCNGRRIESTEQFEHVDPHNGVRVIEVEMNVTKGEVDGVFDGEYKCECYAWNSKGHIASAKVAVELAYIKKQFVESPQPSAAEVGTNVKFRCIPPPAVPPVIVTWYRNGQPLAGDESLLLPQVSLQDIANYTCVAENIAGRRESEPALLTVFVNGGWSEWGAWSPCRCGSTTSGRKRSRTCSEPAPVNDGAPCRGSAVVKTDDCIVCPNGGLWSLWGEWSACNSDCVRVRLRECSGTCNGPTLQHAKCVDGLCLVNQQFYDHNMPLYIGISIVLAVVLAASAIFFVWCRSKRVNRPGYILAGTPKSYASSRRDKSAPDVTRACNEYWLPDNNQYDSPNVADSSYSLPFQTRGHHRQPSSSNQYEMKPYSPSGDSASSCCTYTRTMTSKSSDCSVSTEQVPSLSPGRNTPRVDLAVTLPTVPLDSSYRDRICLTVVK